MTSVIRGKTLTSHFRSRNTAVRQSCPSFGNTSMEIIGPEQRSFEDCINDFMVLLARIYGNDYPLSRHVKDGLIRVLRNRFKGSLGLFKDSFIHPTIKLLETLKEKNFPLTLSQSGQAVVHLVPPPIAQFQVGEFFFQVGHTQPGSLAAKFVKYETGHKVVLQNSTISEGDYDVAFTDDFFDALRREATRLGDVLMRTLVLCNPDGSIEKEELQRHLYQCPFEHRARVRSDSHLSIEETGDNGPTSLHSQPSENLEEDDLWY